MNLTEWLTLETEEGEIEFKVLVDTEDGEWEILTETITLNGAPYIPTTEEWRYMEEETEEQARIAVDQYNEERLESWED
jgi:hypothetical protein